MKGRYGLDSSKGFIMYKNWKESYNPRKEIAYPRKEIAKLNIFFFLFGLVLGIRWAGSETLFWNDIWLGNQPW